MSREQKMERVIPYLSMAVEKQHDVESVNGGRSEKGRLMRSLTRRERRYTGSLSGWEGSQLRLTSLSRVESIDEVRGRVKGEFPKESLRALETFVARLGFSTSILTVASGACAT